MIHDSIKNIIYRKTKNKKNENSNIHLLGLMNIELNLTELCNRKCSFCPRNNSKIYPNQNLNMEVQTAINIKKHLIKNNYKNEISIAGFGEPLLNKNFLKILNIFSNSFFTELISNGDVLKKNNTLINRIFKTKIGMLTINCYDDKNQVIFFNEKLKSYKGRFRIKTLFDTGEKHLLDLYNFNNRGGSLYKQNSLKRECYLPFYKAFIDWNGDVRLCCNDWLRKHEVLGNVNKEDFSKIWNSEKLNFVRKNLIHKHRKKINPCNKCSINGKLIGKKSFESFKKKLNEVPSGFEPL